MKKILIGTFIAILLINFFFIYKILQRNNEVKKTKPTAATDKKYRLIDEKDLGFTIKIPSGYAVEKNGQYSRLIIKKSQQPETGPANFIYISVIPKGKENEEGTIYNYSQNDFKILRQMQPGQTRKLSGVEEPTLAQYYTYESIQGLMLGGYGAKAFKNSRPWEFPEGTTEYRYIVEFEEASYIIGGYTNETSKSDALRKTQMDQILRTITLTPQTIKAINSQPPEEGKWQTFTSPENKISFTYPGNWPRQLNSQNFRSGDIFSLVVIGQTQRTQTELYDGVAFAVMKPVTTSNDLQTWVKEQYQPSEVVQDRPNEFSKITFANRIYEKTVVCGLGCFTYYHTKHNGNIYGFMVNAVGPNEMYYTSVVEKIISNIKYY